LPTVCIHVYDSPCYTPLASPPASLPHSILSTPPKATRRLSSFCAGSRRLRKRRRWRQGNATGSSGLARPVRIRVARSRGAGAIEWGSTPATTNSYSPVNLTALFPRKTAREGARAAGQGEAVDKEQEKGGAPTEAFASPPSPSAAQEEETARHPNAPLAVPYECRAQQGDVLYVPSRWWHQVQSSPDEEGKTVAVNLWYRPWYHKLGFKEGAEVVIRNEHYAHLAGERASAFPCPDDPSTVCWTGNSALPSTPTSSSHPRKSQGGIEEEEEGEEVCATAEAVAPHPGNDAATAVSAAFHRDKSATT